MSTKIYDGLIVTGSNPFVVARRIREVVEPLYLERMDRFVSGLRANEGKTYADVLQNEALPQTVVEPLAGKVVPSFPWDVVRDAIDITEALYKHPMRTFTNLDFSYRVVLIENADGGNPLVLLFSEAAGGELRTALRDAGVVRDYSYWNNSDAPEDVSSTEWEARKRAWSALDVPSEDGLLIEPPFTEARMRA